MRTSILALAGIATLLPAQTQVTPLDRASLEGSSSTIYPLGRAHCRLQQLIGDLQPRPAGIRGHAYRRDAIALTGTVPAFRAEVEVSVSASPRPAHDPSRTFADNRGPQPIVVLPRSWISFPSTDRPRIDPAPTFALRIPYQAPFPWPGGVLCLETAVYANDVGGVPDRNFSVLEDAHELFAGGRSVQPGYRFGAGCPVPGRRTAAGARFDLHQLGSSMQLEVHARFGAPTDPRGEGLSTLLLGSRPVQWAWPTGGCFVLVPPELVVPLAGPNDDKGHWDGRLDQLGSLPAGTVLFAQVISGQPATGLGAMSDGSRLTVPPLGPPTIQSSRVAHGSDPGSPTGAISFAVPVTEVF